MSTKVKSMEDFNTYSSLSSFLSDRMVRRVGGLWLVWLCADVCVGAGPSMISRLTLSNQRVRT